MSLRERRSPGSTRTADRRHRRTSATGNVVGAAMLVTGAGLVLAGLVDLVEDGADTEILAATGAVVGGIGIALRHRLAMPDRVPPRVALRSVMVAAVAMVAVSTTAYLVTGAITDPADALFESTAGLSTTALTVFEDLESVDQGVLFWRALTQWLGGFFALATIVAVLPFLGVGGPKPAGVSAPKGAKHLFSPHTRRLLRTYFGLYLGLTAVGAGLFLLGGMGPFDATCYSLTTISTGGFGNHDRSFAHFDSALIEWLGVAGMLLGGLSLPLAWQALRGRRLSPLRSTELTAYLGLIVGATAVLSVTTDSGSGTHDTIRQAAFSATSAVSTTGHWVTDWTGWEPGPQMLLLVLVGVGAMSGAIGGGFRILRALALVSYIWRELVRQLVPGVVRVVRVGGVRIDEGTVDRMIGYQVVFIGTATAGLLGLALSGFDLLTAMSGAISALSTFGPALGELAPGTPLGGLDRWPLLVLMALMLSGRVELYPVLNAVVSVLRLPGRALDALGDRRRRERR